MWLYSQEDDVFNNIRMQGHSHVNMATNPSLVDVTHQEKILEQLEDDMFYIFMIWNKSFQYNVKIYDLKKNCIFDNSCTSIKMLEGGVDLNDFISSANELVKNKSYSAAPATTVNNKNEKVSDKKKTEPKTSKPVTKIGAGWSGKDGYSDHNSKNGRGYYGQYDGYYDYYKHYYGGDEE